jgi:DNA-directed RNA polymerase subunit beta'
VFRFLINTPGNLLKPSDDRFITVLTQDILLPSYYLTLFKDGEKSEGKLSINESKVIIAYELGVIRWHGKIK